MKPATFAPAYVGVYPILCEVARDHGYALAVHGTVSRDFDLVAIPWIEEAKPAVVLIEAMRVAAGGLIIADGTPAGRFNGTEFEPAVVEQPSRKPHGRLAWNIHLDCGAVLDISVMPRHAGL